MEISMELGSSLVEPWSVDQKVPGSIPGTDVKSFFFFVFLSLETLTSLQIVLYNFWKILGVNGVPKHISEVVEAPEHLLTF